jgi:hypothetical protein
LGRRNKKAGGRKRQLAVGSREERIKGKEKGAVSSRK